MSLVTSNEDDVWNDDLACAGVLFMKQRRASGCRTVEPTELTDVTTGNQSPCRALTKRPQDSTDTHSPPHTGVTCERRPIRRHMRSHPLPTSPSPSGTYSSITHSPIILNGWLVQVGFSDSDHGWVW